MDPSTGRSSERPPVGSWARSYTVSIEAGGRTIALKAEDDQHRFNRFWLRDLCPSLPTKQSGLRTFSVASLPDDLAARAAEIDHVDPGDILVLEWSDGHVSRYPVNHLLSLAERAAGRRTPLLEVELFGADTEPGRFDGSELTPGSLTHLELLMTVARRGFALVGGLAHDGADRGTDAPAGPTTEDIARLLGRVRETDFGRIFDIVTEPEAWTLSQSDKGQDPHTDDPYRYRPSGISILHCCQAAAGDGGASLLVDGFAVAEHLRRDDPGGFRLLATVAVPYVRHRTRSVEQGEDVHMVAYGPVITLGEGETDAPVVGIRFHERSTDVFDLDPAIVDDYYLAFRSFARWVRSPRFQYVRKLNSGEAIVFDNQRVLHGRTGFSSGGGRRHLRLCTVDRDQVHSRLRRLIEVHDPGHERVRLCGGAAPA